IIKVNTYGATRCIRTGIQACDLTAQLGCSKQFVVHLQASLLRQTQHTPRVGKGVPFRKFTRDRRPDGVAKSSYGKCKSLFRPVRKESRFERTEKRRPIETSCSCGKRK